MIALSFMIGSLSNLSTHDLFTAMLAHQSSAIVTTWLYQGQAGQASLSLLVALVIALRLVERRKAPAPVAAPAA
jgi:hypothetical protein